MSYDSRKIPIYDPIDGYDHLWTHYRQYHSKLDQRINRKRLQFLPRNLQDKHILDIGGWDGRLLKYFKDSGYGHYTIIDGSQVLLDHAPSWPHLSKIQADLEDAWPIDDHTVDVCVCFFVIGHLSDISHLCQELHRVCKPWASVIIQHHHEPKPYIHHIWSDIYKIHTYQHDTQQLISELHYVGFDTYIHDIVDKHSITSQIIISHTSSS